MKRRKFLVFGVSSGFGVLGGCGAPGVVGGSKSETLYVHNETDKPNKVVFTVYNENSDKKIIDETFTLTPGSKKKFEFSATGTVSIATKLGSDYSRSYTWTGGSCPDAPLHILIYGVDAIDFQESACD